MERDVALEIASLIGQPINPQLPIPVELSAIADTFTANPGEKIWKFNDIESYIDVILAVDTSSGVIVPVKRNPLGIIEMTFQGLNSKLEYVLLDAVLASPDTDILSRRKESITRGMDKRELKLILDAIINGTATYMPGAKLPFAYAKTGADLYDTLVGMKHALEDYGDQYLLLAGSRVKEAIDLYDKSNVGTFRYNVTLPAKLRELGIDVMKIYGKVGSVTDESVEDYMLDPFKCILVAKNSRIAEGKPIKFIRRKITPEIAKLMGAEVNEAQRAIVVNPTPVNVAGSNTLAYGVFGYESIIFAITNTKAICSADLTGVIVADSNIPTD
jgi:hypothetical protein